MTDTVNDITKVVDQIIKKLEAGQWAKSDRLQQVLAELVKVRVAELEASRLSIRSDHAE